MSRWRTVYRGGKSHYYIYEGTNTEPIAKILCTSKKEQKRIAELIVSSVNQQTKSNDTNKITSSGTGSG